MTADLQGGDVPPVLHQQLRERGVTCPVCFSTRPTWNHHGICDRCIALGLARIGCDCVEGRRAAVGTAAHPPTP